MISGARRLSLIIEFDEDDIEGLPKFRKKLNNYIIVKSLGKGSSSKVFLAVDSQTREKYAIKRMKLRDLIRTSNGIAQLQREIDLMKKFHHTNIIKLYEVLYDKRDYYVYLVIEYAENGSLFRYIENNIQIPEISVCSIIKQISSALSSMHRIRYVHQDVKPGNILLCSDGRAILADFGIGHTFQSSTMVVGSPAYQAPEALDDYSSSDSEDNTPNESEENCHQNEGESIHLFPVDESTSSSISSAPDSIPKIPRNHVVFNETESNGDLIKRASISSQSSADELAQKEDVWALGVTMYQTLFLKLPFEGDNLFEIVGNIKRKNLEFPSNTSDGVKELITGMLQIDPLKRISNTEVQQTDIIKNAPDTTPFIPPFKTSNQATSLQQEIDEIFQSGTQFHQITAEPIESSSFSQIIHDLTKNVSPSQSLMLTGSDLVYLPKSPNTNIISDVQESC